MLPGAVNPQRQPQPYPRRLCRPLPATEVLRQRHCWSSGVRSQNVCSLTGTARVWRSVATQYAAQPQPQPPADANSTSGQPGIDDRGQQHRQPTAPDSSASESHANSVSSTRQQAGQQNGAAPPSTANGALLGEAPALEMLAQQDFGRYDMPSCGVGCALASQRSGIQHACRTCSSCLTKCLQSWHGRVKSQRCQLR